MIQHGIIETLQLGLHPVFLILLVDGRNASMLKGETVFKCLFDKERLTYTSPAIYCYKFSTIAAIEPFQLFYLLFSSNDCTHNYYILPQR